MSRFWSQFWQIGIDKPKRLGYNVSIGQDKTPDTEDDKMNRQQIQQIASQIYTQQQKARQQYERVGMKPTALMSAAVEEIASHIEMVEEIAKEYNVSLSYTKVEFGTSFDNVIAMAEKKAKRNRSRAGYLALVSKYGEAAAKRIISK